LTLRLTVQQIQPLLLLHCYIAPTGTATATASSAESEIVRSGESDRRQPAGTFSFSSTSTCRSQEGRSSPSSTRQEGSAGEEGQRCAQRGIEIEFSELAGSVIYCNSVPVATCLFPFPCLEKEIAPERMEQQLFMDSKLCTQRGVTLVLSGFVNPERGVLRDKALAMGAVYEANWCATHSLEFL
jgi:hypothetical protein